MVMSVNIPVLIVTCDCVISEWVHTQSVLYYNAIHWQLLVMSCVGLFPLWDNHMICMQCCASHAFTTGRKSVLYYVVITYYLYADYNDTSFSKSIPNCQTWQYSTMKLCMIILYEYGSFSAPAWFPLWNQKIPGTVSEIIVINQLYTLIPILICIHIHVIFVIVASYMYLHLCPSKFIRTLPTDSQWATTI